MKASIEFELPIRTVNESNGDKGMAAHWKKTKLRKQAQYAVGLKTSTINRPRLFPMVVEIVRLSAGVLDDDGLRSATKAARDGIAKWIGVDDGDVERIRFKYGQATCKRGEYGVIVRVYEGCRLVERIEEAA